MNFITLSEKKRHKNLLKVTTAKKSFPSVYIIDITCFDEGFLFHVITGRYYFLHKFIVSLRFGKTAMFLETSVLKEVRILYPLSPQKRCNAADTKDPQ